MYYLGQTGMTPEEQERVYHQEAAAAAQQHQMAMAAATAAGMMKTEDGECFIADVFQIRDGQDFFVQRCSFLLHCSEVRHSGASPANTETRWSSDLPRRLSDGLVDVQCHIDEPTGERSSSSWN